MAVHFYFKLYTPIKKIWRRDLLLKRRLVADFAAFVFNTYINTLQVIGCKVHEIFEDLYVCRQTGQKHADIEYVFIPFSTNFYSMGRHLRQFIENTSKVYFHNSARLVICIDLGGYAVAFPKQCFNAMADFGVLKCYANHAFEDYLDLIENIVNSLEDSGHRCEVLAFIYRTLEEYKKCQEELISINGKILRYFLTIGTTFLINTYPYLPEQVEKLQRSQNSIRIHGVIGLPSPYSIKGKIDLSSQHTSIQKVKLSPQDDLILAYMSRVASLVFNQRLMTDICLYSIGEFDALINEIEKIIKVLAPLTKNRKRIDQFLKEIESRINEIRIRCQQHKNVKEELDDRLNRINIIVLSIEEELKKCSVQAPKEINKLVHKAQSIIINKCINNALHKLNISSSK